MRQKSVRPRCSVPRGELAAISSRLAAAGVRNFPHPVAVGVPAPGSTAPLIEPAGARPGSWDSQPPRCRRSPLSAPLSAEPLPLH